MRWFFSVEAQSLDNFLVVGLRDFRTTVPGNMIASRPERIKTPRPNTPEVAFLTWPKPWSPTTQKLEKGTWATKAPKCFKLTCFWQVFWSLFEGLQIWIFRGPCKSEAQPEPSPGQNYGAQQREIFETAPGAHKHRKAKSSACSDEFSAWLFEGLQT